MPFLTLLTNPIVKYALVALAIGAAIFAWDQHVKHQAVAALLVKEQKATEQEHERRLQAEQQAQQQAQADADRIAAQEKHNETLMAAVNRLSRAHDRTRCLDADSVRRLGAIGQAIRH